MNFNDYSEASKATAIYPGQGTFIGALYCALGLAGEAGEVCGKISKHIRDGNSVKWITSAPHDDCFRIELDKEIVDKLADEIGDVLWFMDGLASEIGVSLDYVAERNVEKLRRRKESGTLSGSGDNR